MSEQNTPNESMSSEGTPSPDAPKKDSGKNKNLVSNILIVVGIALLVVAGIIWFNNNQNYQKIDQENERVAEYAKLSNDEDTPPQVDWEALKAMNPDIVGWLQIPNTVVNFPVFQTGDNSFYLDHAPDKSNSIGGSVFLDYETTAPGLVDPQTIVYGHHMRNGSQFKQVADMDNQSVFDGVKTVWYVTEKNGPYNLAPLYLFYTNEDDTEVRRFTFENDQEFRKYINTYYKDAVAKRSDADELVKHVKHLFTLSTCNYYDGYGRTLLVCAPKSEIPGTPQYQEAQAAAKATEAQKAQQQAQQPSEPQAESSEGQGEAEGEQQAETNQSANEEEAQ